MVQREFEIFVKASAASVAVKRGFSWPGFFFTWLWAFTRKLWLPGGLLLLAGVVITLLSLTLLRNNAILCIPLGLIVSFIVGLRGNSWRSKQLEDDGYAFSGLVVARSAASAVAKYA